MDRWQKPTRRCAGALAIIAAGACGNGTRPVEPRPNDGPSFSLLEWTAPVNLGGVINTGSSELQLGIAPNGRTLYVSSNRAGTLGDQDLWVSKKQTDGSWGPLTNLGPIVNSNALDSSPTLSLDGHYLYFSSRRSGGLGGLDCWRSYRVDPSDESQWQAPENLGPPVNSTFDDADCFPQRSGNGMTLWFTSFNRPGGNGDWDIYTSEIGPDGSFGPASLVDELNTPSRDTRMTVTNDGLTVIFSSNRAGGSGGIDLWMAQRPAANMPFCTPVNLGVTVNTAANERSPSIATNGLELYFTSTRPGGLGSDDVYRVARVGGPPPRDCQP
jgi:Tol biopolymer transport system component